MIAVRVAALLAVALAGAAHADIFSWRDASGARQISNVPPPWYSPTEPSRIRTQVLVNGQLVDDTGLPAAEREKLQARRAKAESWGRPAAPTPVAAPAAAPAPAPVTATDPASKTPPPPPPIAGADAAKSAEGLRRALEAQKMADSLADQLKASSRPRQ